MITIEVNEGQVVPYFYIRKCAIPVAFGHKQ